MYERFNPTLKYALDTEQMPPILKAPENPRLYSFSARLVAGMIRLGLRPTYIGLRISQKMYEPLRPMQKYVLEELEHSPKFYIWIGALAATGLLAAFSLAASLVLSMEILEFSRKIPWATLVSSYAWLVVVGSGLCIINALGGVFGMHRYEMMSKRMAFLSLITILFGLQYIFLHLGRPERAAIYSLISPNLRSAIAWMGSLYSIYLGIVVVELWLLIRKDFVEMAKKTTGLKRTIYTLFALKKLDDDSRLAQILNKPYLGQVLYHPRLHSVLNDPRLPRLIGLLAFVTGVAALTMLGSVFAHTESRALWYGPYYPIYFIVSAIFLGYAFLLAVTIITYKVKGDDMPSPVKAFMFEMAHVLTFLLAVGFALTAFRLFTSIWDPARQGPVMLLLNGPFSLGFWGFEVGLMSLLPAFILIWAASKKSLGGALSGSVMVLIGAFVMRYDFLVAGQVYPNIKEGLPSYLPTMMEIFIIVGVFGGFLFVYTLGEKFLPLKENTL
jgi:molybdopterin-containing oxidoreductase family membrane subunit